MAAFGFAELVMILLFGSTLPTDLEPLSADQLLNGMPAECELLLVQDVRGAYDAMNGLLDRLSTQSWLMGNPEIVEGINELRAGIARLPAEMTAMIGFDPLTHLSSVGLCGRLATSGSGDPMPSFLVVVQGSFDATVAATFAASKDIPQVTLSNGATVYGTRENGTIIGAVSPGPGLFLVGTEDLLAERAIAGAALPQAWQTAPAGSLVGRVAALAPGGPRTIAAFAPSAGTRFLVGAEAPVSLGQLLAGLGRAVLLSNGTTTYLETTATNAEGHRDFELILGSLGAYMEASPHAMRAIAYFFLGILSPDDPEIDDELRALLRGREEILSFLSDMGAFSPATVTFNSDAASLTTTLEIESEGGAATFGALMGVGASFFVSDARRDEALYYDSYPAYEVEDSVAPAVAPY